jgi:putative transposase
VSFKDRRAVATALKDIYRAKDDLAAVLALDAFEAGPWGEKYPAIVQSWRRAWSEVIPFYAFPGDVRRILYTTNAIEALNAKLRRAVRARGHFPTDEAAIKLLFLVLHRAEKEWIMPPREWTMAKAQFAIRVCQEFRVWGSNRMKGPPPCRVANPLLFRMPCLTSYSMVPIPGPPSTRTASLTR